MAGDCDNHTLFICATPRCGSTYFCTLLRQAGVVGWPGEWLGRAGERNFRDHYKLPASTSFAGFVKELRCQRSGANGEFSVKSMWPHLLQFIKRGREAAGLGAEVSDRAVLEHYLGNLRILYLYREDSLGQAISLYRAKHTRLWNQLSDYGHFIEFDAPYDFAAIAEHSNWISHHNRCWQKFFKENGLEVVTRRFEDFIKEDPKILIEDTLEALGYDHPEAFINYGSPTRKQSDGKTRLWRERFEQRLRRISDFPESSHDVDYPDEAYTIQLHFEDDLFWVDEGILSAASVTIVMPASYSWMDVGLSNGDREALLEISLNGPSENWERYEQVLVEPLSAGRSHLAEWIIPAELNPGLYTLEIDLLRRGEGRVSERGGMSAQGFLWVEANDRLKQAADYFGTDAIFPQQSRIDVSWLGLLEAEHFPWVRHPQLEWIRLSGTGVAGDDYWMFIPDVGLLWTSEEVYPDFFLPDKNDWVTFIGVERNAKIFTRESTKERFSIKIQAYRLPFRADPLFS